MNLTKLPRPGIMAVDLEKEHVQRVYDGIAQHFSVTRYKAWPVVEDFVNTRGAYSVGLDVGCGNGKNMLIRSDLHMTGFDLSCELLGICQSHNLEAVRGHMVSLPFRSSSQDFIICIAALHHLACWERRVQAVQEMCRVLLPGGEMLLYVWAFEQPPSSSLYKHGLQYISEDKQDVLVPWRTGETTKLRYYHLFREGELEELVVAAAALELQVIYTGYDKDNWYVCVRKCSNGIDVSRCLGHSKS